MSDDRLLTGFISRVCKNNHDHASKFVHVLALSSPVSSSLPTNRQYLTVDDWDYLVQDIIDTHPGLKFLREAREFHSRYIKTVIARVYYNCNRTWSGKLTVQELRRSNFLSVRQTPFSLSCSYRRRVINKVHNDSSSICAGDIIGSTICLLSLLILEDNCLSKGRRLSSTELMKRNQTFSLCWEILQWVKRMNKCMSFVLDSRSNRGRGRHQSYSWLFFVWTFLRYLL